MVRGVREEHESEFDKGRKMGRRQMLSLAVLAFGASTVPQIRERVDAAKKKKKGEKGKKEKTNSSVSSSGNEVVRVAQKYEGARYTWGGASPKGFDCSGFTWYVYQKATGMDITRGVDEQWQHGRSVGHGEWQAGDIVFFENTFKRGLSHVGIYINGNKFIHAENEQTGVIISTLDSDYYSDHYAGARRLL
jgi:cell wall-associated NlpC family hydrolase